MSYKHTLDGIQKPLKHTTALRALLLERLTRPVPMDADRTRMIGMIEKRIYSRDLQELEDNTKEYVIPIKSFSVTTDGVIHGKKNIELSFWLPINKRYSIHVTIHFNSLNEGDKEKMDEVKFLDDSGKICSLYELYCYATNKDMPEKILPNFIMGTPSDRFQSMLSALKWAFKEGTLVLTPNGNQNFLDIIEKAGSLSGYDDVQIPHILQKLPFKLSRYSQGGGRGRQRRRRISLLSRKKRNTRMKKSKKYNKSKKIKK